MKFSTCPFASSAGCASRRAKPHRAVTSGGNNGSHGKELSALWRNNKGLNWSPRIRNMAFLNIYDSWSLKKTGEHDGSWKKHALNIFYGGWQLQYTNLQFYVSSLQEKTHTDQAYLLSAHSSTPSNHKSSSTASIIWLLTHFIYIICRKCIMQP